ncbi:hypothetical protein ACOL3G_02355 [Aliarcobacter butzleri]
MAPLDFFIYAIENWYLVGLWTIFFGFLLYFAVKKIAVGGIFDPIHLSYTFTFGTKYAIVCSLYFSGYISNYLFFVVVLFGISFYLTLIYFSNKKQIYFNRMFSLLVPKNNSHFEFKIIFLIYSFIALYIVSKIGFGFFASTNRFDNNQGYGAFVRITDVLGTFIIAYLSIVYYERYKRLKRNDLKQYLHYVFLFIFIVFFTILNGAKAAFIFALITIVLAIRASGNKFKISFIKGTILLSIATFFAIIGLYINLLNNNMESSGEGQHIKGVPVVAEKFIHRILANGNQSYMSLPNDVIKQIKTDNIFIRLLTPIIGTSQMSRIVGYPVNNLGVGRQIILYYTDMDVAGGPTSHFDLFSYVYFGIGGIVFVIFLGYLLGSINKLLKTGYQKSIFFIALVSTLWIRSMAIILEPAVGLAYIFDVIIIFFLLHVFIFILSKVQNRGNLKCIV